MSIADSPKIEPCPACGNHQTRLFPVVTPGDYRFVECLNCGATGSHHPGEVEAIAQWNRLSLANQALTATETMEELGTDYSIHCTVRWDVAGEYQREFGDTIAEALITYAAALKAGAK